jgi:hypothetical protein
MKLSEIWDQGAIPAPLNPLIVALRDFDRVRLIKPITDNDRELHAGSVGTVVQCLADGYEVEFPGGEGSFQVSRGILEKI